MNWCCVCVCVCVCVCKGVEMYGLIRCFYTLSIFSFYVFYVSEDVLLCWEY